MNQNTVNIFTGHLIICSVEVIVILEVIAEHKCCTYRVVSEFSISLLRINGQHIRSIRAAYGIGDYLRILLSSFIAVGQAPGSFLHKVNGRNGSYNYSVSFSLCIFFHNAGDHIAIDIDIFACLVAQSEFRLRCIDDELLSHRKHCEILITFVLQKT